MKPNDLPQFDTAALRAKDAAHHLHPFTDTQSLNAAGSRVIVRGEGVRIWDSEGNEIIDGMSGLWCVNLGYGRQDLVDAATRQMQTLPFYNAFFKTTTAPAAELAALLPQVAPPGFNHVFFTNSGSEGNDTIIRLVRRYWDLMGQPQRKTIISRHNAYHGSTLGGASLGGMSGMHEQGDLPLPGITHIDQPYQLQHGQPGESAHDFGLRAAGWLEAKILELGADKVAAFIGEPVQGAGGVIIPPASYWPEIQRICDQYGILLISDEVICGFGRLGTWFGCQHPHIDSRPDLITFAKGVTSGYLPLGGVLVGERVAKVLIEQGGEFHHGFTYSGHPTCCAVAIANVKALRDEGVVERVATDTAPYLKAQFATLADHPLVGDVDSLGMVAGLVLYKDKASRTLFPAKLGVGYVCRDHCFRNGVVMRAVEERMIIAPPLVMSHDDIDEMIRRIRRSLDDTLSGLRAQGLV
ncbi:MAG: aspartate aminotransferase family protein [Thiomonas sp.]|uniref:aspartate aminotransferase family protein n=1 Tax=Thiomonas sp. TaxID=2047785 RepID=UPI002A35F065|nr:aspartate aminotransferase family protein [Thiomonas sp.]MDY0329188.1 aspartate aminotransferase family protein [Thiomonas sp.]